MRTSKTVVFIGDLDVSNYVSSLRYERSADKDDYVHIIFRRGSINEIIKLADDKRLDRGNIVRFQYGFVGQPLSNMHIAYIREVKVDYREKITIEVKALDKGAVMKLNYRTKPLNGKIDDIVKSIAKDYKLETDIEPNHNFKRYSAPSQSFRSDYDLLRRLANYEGGFDFYVSNNRLTFRKTGGGNKIVRVFKYGEDDIVSLTVELRAVKKTKNEVETTSTRTIHPNVKSIQEIIADNKQRRQEESDFNQMKRQVVKDIIDKKVKKDYGDDRLNAYRTTLLQEFDAGGMSKFSNPDYIEKKRLKQLALNSVNQEIAKVGYDNIESVFKNKEVAEKLCNAYGTSDLADFYIGDVDTGQAGIDGNTGEIIMLSVRPKFSQNSTLSSDSNGDEAEPEKKRFEADVEVELDPLFEIGDKVRLDGIANRHGGVWTIVSILDDVKAQGASFTTITCAKRAKLSDGNEESLIQDDNTSNENKGGFRGGSRVYYEGNGDFESTSIDVGGGNTIHTGFQPGTQNFEDLIKNKK